MIAFPRIDPVIVQVGPLAVRWYGLMYLLGFAAAYFLVRKQIAEFPSGAATAPHDSSSAVLKGGESGNTAQITEYQHLDGLMFYLVIGVIAGGRLGYVLFYNLSWFLEHPLEIFATWHGGMSFHGGTLGALVAGYIYCRKFHLDFLLWADRFIVTAPVGLGLGRLGNFINGELYGRAADVPWAMVFPHGGNIPRHPSQLYEAALEGVLLFLILWPLRKKSWPSGRKTALFLMCYSVCRVIVEFFREPDAQLGFIFSGWLTMGQLLSVCFMVAGIFLWVMAGRIESKPLNPAQSQ